MCIRDRVKPDTVTINVDEYAERKIPVEIVPIGKFSDDVALKSVTIVPKEVTVSGRKQLVNAVNKVVMKVNISGQTKNFSAVSTLEAWDISGNVLDVHINPSQGQAQYELNLLRKDKAVPITVPTVGTAADGYEVKSISVTPTQLTVTGREDVYKRQDMDSITDAGAHATHCFTTTTAGEHKSIPLYNKATAIHYGTEGVYMNHTPGGAFRGYGATEALWPLECACLLYTSRCV